ncbi:putative ribose/galactose/methyl galactoside import ATP-binding protein 1 [Spirochaetia bacterium]|nr:putative ribose/galactose/methyl galactoside import ATP-binding protein 1 [Spirochaetia bacterium]
MSSGGLVTDYLLEMRGIEKEFPGVKALQNVNINLLPGEVHAIVGENGAGKSTLMKVLNGVYQPDAGSIFIGGVEAKIDNIYQAQHFGISIVFQEFNLCNHISVANNVFIGRLDNKFGVVNDRVVKKNTKQLLDRLDIDINPDRLIKTLSVAQKQMVEIAKAVSLNARVIIFDEPTSSLTSVEIEQLFKIIRQLKAEGKGIFYISHRMEELPVIADRITVLRDGQYIATTNSKEITPDELIKLMVGRELNSKFPGRNRRIGEVFFEAKNIKRKGIINVDGFSLRRGEVLGVAGLIGSGRTETMRAIFGADKVDEPMDITLDGKKVKISQPSSAIYNGIAYLTEDRKETGLALTMDIERNINMASHKEYSWYGIMNGAAAAANAQTQRERFSIRIPGLWQKAMYLSGGNQQKVVLAKWLCRNVKVLIMDEPTRGIDVGAKYEIYKLMDQLLDTGIGIIMISSELPEILGMSDRVIVFHAGSIAGVLPIEEATQIKILEYAAGLHNKSAGVSL